MGDAAEGLIDADARIQELMEEREESRKAKSGGGQAADPDRLRQLESFRLARTELQRQLGATMHQGRREQIGHAIAELERRIATLSA